MLEKLPVFITSHPVLVALALLALICALILEMRKGGRPINVASLTSLINQNQVRVVDIRPEKDFKTGHINGSVNIPQDRLLSQTALLSKADKTTVLVCSTGMQCRSMVEKLGESGIRSTRLAGGIGEWTASNIPLTK